MVASRWPQRLRFLAAAIRRSISRPVRYSRVRTSELTVVGAARPPARFSTLPPALECDWGTFDYFFLSAKSDRAKGDEISIWPFSRISRVRDEKPASALYGDTW